ncbi:MAG: hypothetical protein M3Z37_06560 [Candidatus Eremiobacteraeota bacterium]|nr:hypothetical protein [Candidatus Eremiobacteraeota bacterium]
MSGNLRSYYFTRHFQQGVNQTAFALGGNLHADAVLAKTFSAGATYGLVTPLGTAYSDPATVDATLPGTSLSVLEEAYLRYHGGSVAATIGRQKVSTPWAHPSDSRILPNTFQGLSASVKVSQWMTASALRMVRYKSRTSNTFEANDLLSNKPTAGFLAIGDVYNHAGTSAQAWFYDFYGTAGMTYVDATQRFAPGRTWAPYVGLQYVSEIGDTRRLPANVRAQGYGINIGLKSERADISIALNDVPFQSGAYKNGGIAAPYTYADTDPLFTTITGEGLTDKGAGHANRLLATLWSSQNRARLTAARAEYYLYGPSKFANNHVLTTNVDLTYFVGNGKRGEQFRGLSVRDRWIDTDTPGPPFTFIYNRAQLQYDF